MISAASAGTAVAMAVGGVIAVLVLSAVFYVVGRGEDRDRANDVRDGAQDPPAEDPAAGEPPRPRPPRPAASARRRRRP